MVEQSGKQSTSATFWEAILRGEEPPGGIDARLAELAGAVGRRWPDCAGELADALASSADAELSLLRLLDVPEDRSGTIDRAGVRRFVHLAAQSRTYGRWVARDPERLLDRAGQLDRVSREIEELLGQVGGEGTESRFRHALRVRRRLRSLGVIEAEAIDGERLEETAAMVSEAAREAIADAWRWVERGAGLGDQRVCVIAMGKLGGEELNFHSDIDVVFVCDPVGEMRSEALGRGVRHFAEILEDPMDPGLVFRVDLRLRPFGTQGALVHGVDQMLAYFEQHGRTWERGAWIRAAAVAGDREVGARLLDRLRPFVYRRNLDEAAIGEIAAMKRQVDAQQRSRDAGRGRSWDVKLGAGGIREIEFFVQAFQLVWGGRHPQLRERGTLPALQRLAEFGLLPERARARLTDAWRFLRLVEHRLQMDEDQQSQRLPPSGPGMALLARRLGFADEDAFRAELDRHRSEVRHRWERLFADEASTASPDDAWVSGVVDGLSEECLDERLSRLAELGFASPARVLRDLERLAAPPEALIGRFAPGPIRRAVEPLLAGVVETALPDRGLERCVGMLSRRGSRQVVLKVLQSRPRAATVLASFFGTSGELGGLIAREPVVLERILSGGGVRGMGAEAVRVGFEEALQREEARYSRPSRERRLVAIRRQRATVELEVALGQLSGRLAATEATPALSALAEACLDRTLDEAVADLGDRLPAEARERFGALALGKLGAGELGHGGDLDLVFVYEDDPALGGIYARLAQRWIAFLSTPMAWGRCYSVDMRLRPDGSQGAVVTTVDGLRGYHRGRSWAWEALALVRARPVSAGDGLARRLEALVGEVLGSVDPARVRVDLRRIRAARLEELEARGGPRDLKACAGGLMDLEHLVQTTWLSHRGTVERGRGATVALVEGLAGAGVFGRPEAESLVRINGLYRTVESRLRLSEGADRSVLPVDPRHGDALARWVLDRADADRGELEFRLAEAAGEVVVLWERWMGG